MIVSVFGGNPDQFAEVAGWFTDIAAGFELNVSCPHAAGYGAQIGTNPDLVKRCTEAVAQYHLPVWVKLTPNVTDISSIGKAAEEGGADALVAINTVKAMRISTNMRRPVLGNRFGGLSGKAVFPIAVRCVYELYEAVDIPVIGCGGSHQYEDVIEVMMAGASDLSRVCDQRESWHFRNGRIISSDGICARRLWGVPMSDGCLFA